MSSSDRRFAALLGAAFFLLPAAAWAWGPVAHLDLATSILDGAVAVAPAVLRLLTRRRDDFLYGALFADAVVAKNLAREGEHSHDWTVARSLMADAQREGESREAFALGYLAHLGADVIAHNHVVPQLFIENFRAARAGHVYWEARIDTRLLELRPELGDVWRELMARKQVAHDKFLAERLVPTLLPNRLSTGVFRRSLGVQRNAAFRLAVRRIDENSKLLIDQGQLLKWRALALEASRKALNNPKSARLDALDPKGEKALALATAVRRTLRRSARRGDPELEEAVARARLRVRFVDIALFEPDD